MLMLSEVLHLLGLKPLPGRCLMSVEILLGRASHNVVSADFFGARAKGKARKMRRGLQNIERGLRIRSEHISHDRACTSVT